MHNETNRPRAYRAPDDPPKGTQPVAPAPTAPAAPAEDNSVIKGMRQQIAESKTALEEATTKLKDIERKDMAETERLTAENKDLADKATKNADAQAALDAANTQLKGIYDANQELVPEEHRKSVEKLSASGDWPTRLATQAEAIKMVPKPLHAGTAPKVPKSDAAAAVVAEGGEPPKPFDPKDVNPNGVFTPIDPAKLKAGQYADPNAITKADLNKAVQDAVAAATKK